jgi:hypothetical protein
VFVNGVKLVNGVDFTATNGTTVVLTDALTVGQIVEIDNYLTAFLPTNALRTITTFTATAAQTTFSVTYTQGLIDVFYNGSCLAQSEYTATNGTSIILATACQVNDIVVVYAYSYSVGAYSGIGGSGTSNYVSKFTASSVIGNSIIQDNGTNVSIGGTANTNSRLTLVDGTSIAAYWKATNANAAARDWTIITNNANFGDFAIRQGNSQGSDATSGTDRLLISASGAVGIGTSSPASPLTINATAGAAQFNITRSEQTNQGFSIQAGGGETTFNSYDGTNSVFGAYVFNSTKGSTTTERMRITSGGNVGIGTSTPTNLAASYRSVCVNGSSAGFFETRVNDVSSGRFISDANATGFGDIRTGIPIYFYTQDTERMRITSGGAVYINTTSALPGSGTLLHVDSPAAGPSFKNAASGQQSLMLWNAVSSGDNLFVEFNVNTSILGKGSIDYNRAANLVRYNTTSDAHLKNIIGDSNLEKSVEILSSTKIKEYSWKEDETNKPQIGVIAQELYETYKGAVSVGSDEELLGTEDYKSWKVDKTAFTFHLIAGWQKHEKIINDLQAQIDELKQIVATK